MARREDMGSWLGRDTATGTPVGDRLGLPASGSGALAGAGRRALALVVDWFACLLISGALFPAAGTPAFSLVRGDPVATLAIFALENVLLVGTVGHTLGHRLCGLRVRMAVTAGPDEGAGRAAVPPRSGSSASGPSGEAGAVVPGRAPGLLRAAVRTAPLLLVVPAVVQDGDGRGLHDRAAGTLIVRR